jgi:hypothetical protein
MLRHADEADLSQEICLCGYTSSTVFARDVQTSAQRDDSKNKKLPDQNPKGYPQMKSVLVRSVSTLLYLREKDGECE